MGSVLNGLGKTSVTFLHNLVSLLVRLAFVFFGIPRAGIRACLWGMLAGELVLSLLHLYSLRRLVPVSYTHLASGASVSSTHTSTRSEAT